MTRRAREALMANAGARFRGRVYIAPPEPSTPSCSSPDYLTTQSRKRSRRGVKRRRNKSSRPTQLVRKSLGDFEFATDECQLFLQSIGLSAQIPGCDDVVSLSQGNRGDESTGASPPTPLQICEESEQTETPISAKHGESPPPKPDHHLPVPSSLFALSAPDAGTPWGEPEPGFARQLRFRHARRRTPRSSLASLTTPADWSDA